MHCSDELVDELFDSLGDVVADVRDEFCRWACGGATDRAEGRSGHGLSARRADRSASLMIAWTRAGGGVEISCSATPRMRPTRDTAIASGSASARTEPSRIPSRTLSARRRPKL